MSAITIDDNLVHFEALGRGRPVILLHGWLGSWRYWVPAMRQLAGKYRTYALDLWGFGDSARDADRYTFDAQVALLEAFIDRMGIKKAALIGHDLGGAVVTRYAVAHADRVARVMVVAPPLFRMAHLQKPLTQNTGAAAQGDGAAAPAPTSAPPAQKNDTPASASTPKVTGAETVPWRTEQMKARIKANLERQAQTTAAIPAPGTNTGAKSPREAATPPDPLPDVPAMPKMDYTPGSTTMQMKLTNPLKDFLKTTDRFKLLDEHVEDSPDRKKLRDEVEKADPLALSMTVESFNMVDTLHDLRQIAQPLMVVYGQKDSFMQLPDARMIEELQGGRTTCAVKTLQNIKHFPMLEEKAAFTRLLMEFLEASDVRHVELTEIWERRVR